MEERVCVCKIQMRDNTHPKCDGDNGIYVACQTRSVKGSQLCLK